VGGRAKRVNPHATTIKGPKAPIPKFVDRQGPVHVQMLVDLWSPRPDPAAEGEERRPPGREST
jgi:hypothetical protein